MSEEKKQTPAVSKRVEKQIKKFQKRRIKEIKNNTKCKDFSFKTKGDNFWYFKFTVKEGLYAGQTHIIEMKLLYGAGHDIFVYPINAPLCRFITKIWHPNISEKGTICLDLLKEQWSIMMTTSNIINAIELLLLNPETSSPQNKSAAEMMEKSKTRYEKKIQTYYNINDEDLCLFDD